MLIIIITILIVIRQKLTASVLGSEVVLFVPVSKVLVWQSAAKQVSSQHKRGHMLRSEEELEILTFSWKREVFTGKGTKEGQNCCSYPDSVHRGPPGSSSQSDRHLCGARSDSCRFSRCCHTLTFYGAYSSGKGREKQIGKDVKRAIHSVFCGDFFVRRYCHLGSAEPTLTSMHRQLGSPFSFTAHSLPAPQNTLAHTLLLLCTSCKEPKQVIGPSKTTLVCTGFTHRAALLCF